MHVCMCAKVHFALSCWDNTITCKKIVLKRRDSSFVKAKSRKKLFLVESGSAEKLLGIQIDSDLTFDKHVSSICNEVGKKINVLSHLVGYMSFDKRRMLMQAFTES